LINAPTSQSSYKLSLMQVPSDDIQQLLHILHNLNKKL